MTSEGGLPRWEPALVAYSLTLAQLRDYAVLRALGLKIATYPTGMLSPATAGIKAGLGGKPVTR